MLAMQAIVNVVIYADENLTREFTDSCAIALHRAVLVYKRDLLCV